MVVDAVDRRQPEDRADSPDEVTRQAVHQPGGADRAAARYANNQETASEGGREDRERQGLSGQEEGAARHRSSAMKATEYRRWLEVLVVRAAAGKRETANESGKGAWGHGNNTSSFAMKSDRHKVSGPLLGGALIVGHRLPRGHIPHFRFLCLGGGVTT